MSAVIDVKSYPGIPASARGWGSGWPQCQTSKWVPLTAAGVSFPGGCHKDIHDLMVLLIEASVKLGLKLAPGECFGAACRAIKYSDGSMSNVPSNHSWGLAVDINSLHNPYGSNAKAADGPYKITPEIVKLWNIYGFRWGGDYPHTKDLMHMEGMQTPSQVRKLTKLARKRLASQPSPGGDELSFADFKAGVRDYFAGKTPTAKERLNSDYMFGYRMERRIEKHQSLPLPTNTTGPESS